MKKPFYIVLFILCFFDVKSQSCEEIMALVKSESYGTTYTSYNSDAIAQVTFYDVTIDYKMYHFVIVCFKKNIHMALQSTSIKLHKIQKSDR